MNDENDCFMNFFVDTHATLFLNMHAFFTSKENLWE